MNLGIAAPHISSARARLVAGLGTLERVGSPASLSRTDEDLLHGQCEFEMVYKDDVSISLSTAYLFNYPTIGFARLPISVTILLSVFSCRVSLRFILCLSLSQPL